MSKSTPKVERAGNVTIITFTGNAVREIENRLAAELEGRTGGSAEAHVLLDFTNVDRINSEEMGTLIGLHMKVKDCGGRLTLFNLNPDVYEAFTVTHLQTLLGICRE